MAYKLFLALLAPLHTHNHMGLVIKLITIHPCGTKILSRQMDEDANKNMVNHRNGEPMGCEEQNQITAGTVYAIRLVPYCCKIRIAFTCFYCF